MKKKVKFFFVVLPLLYCQTLFAQTQIGSEINGEASGDAAGTSISMPDDVTIAVGAIYNTASGAYGGNVRIFAWNGSLWEQKGLDIDGEFSGDYSGTSVSMPDANTVAIGSPNNDGSGISAGQVRIFKWVGSGWIQKGLDIDGEFSNDQSGYSVCMPDSNTVAIGATNNPSAGAVGHVRIYKWNGSMWLQKGGDIDGEFAGDRFGWSISMPDENTIAIGAPNNMGGAYYGGHVRVFRWNGILWEQKGLDIDDEVITARSGYSVSMPDSNTLAIGAPNLEPSATDLGHVRVYNWSGSNWIQKGLDILGEELADLSGINVSMPDPVTVAISASMNDGNGTDAGHVRVFGWNGSAWIQLGIDIDGELAFDQSGYSACMPKNNTLAIGAPFSFGGGEVKVYQMPTNGFIEDFKEKMKLYPNPTTGIFHIKWSKNVGKITYSISTVDGKSILDGIDNSEKISIDMSSFPKGVYFVKAENGIEVFNAKLVLK